MNFDFILTNFDWTKNESGFSEAELRLSHPELKFWFSRILVRLTHHTYLKHNKNKYLGYCGIMTTTNQMKCYTNFIMILVIFPRIDGVV